LKYKARTHPESTGGSLGEKVRGAFETVHGVGDSIRARGMIALDNALGTTQNNEKYAELAEQGRLEAASGMARLGGPKNTATGAHAVNDPARSNNTDSLEDGPSNTAGHGGGINTTENHDAGSVGEKNVGPRAGNTQGPPELPARNNVNNAPPSSE